MSRKADATVMAVDHVVAAMEGPLSREEFFARATAGYSGPMARPAQGIATHLRSRSDVVLFRPGWLARLDYLMDGAYFHVPLTPALVELPWLPAPFLAGYIALREPHATVVDEHTGKPLPWGRRTQVDDFRLAHLVLAERLRSMLDAEEEERQSTLPVERGLDAAQLWGPLFGDWFAFNRLRWLDVSSLVEPHGARPGDSLLFRVVAALEDRVSVSFRRAGRAPGRDHPRRSPELSDHLAALIRDDRAPIPAREAVPSAYSCLPFAREPDRPAVHWWWAAEEDPRLRVVDGVAVAAADYWRRQDEGSGRIRPEGPDLSEAPAGEESREYLFRVALKWQPEVWRTIALTGTHTLDSLHGAIQKAFGWDNDHLYAFFLSNKRWDEGSAYHSPWADDVDRYASGAALGALKLRKGKRFLYLFDFGDCLEHDVRVESIGDVAPGATYPRVVESAGTAPSQYPSWEDDEDEDEEG